MSRGRKSKMWWGGTPVPPCFSTQHPASKLFWKALLHKEKCSVADGALGQSSALALLPLNPWVWVAF